MNSFRNKTFRAVVSAITLVATTSVYSGPPKAELTAVDIVPVHPMYLGTLNGGIKTNDAYTDGNFSIVAPVWSTLGAENTLSGGSLFLEPYISWGEGGEVVSSLGLGYRYLFGDQSLSALTMHDGHQAGFFEEGIAIGANVFIDMLDTEANNQFWQLGVGAELQTRYVELRGNYYIPLSDKQLAEQTRTRSTFTSSSSSTNTFQAGSGYGNPYATGNTIAQDLNLATYATTTTRTTRTTIERLFRRYEEGMEGWDAEMALLVPGVDRYFDLRLIGGYYSFDNQPFGPQAGGTGNVQGWKAGVEVRPVPAIILNGTWYEDPRLTGSDWTVGLQLQMPFEAGDLGDGKDFWDRVGDSFKPRRRHLVERMAEPVHRQNAAIKLANSFDEDVRVVSEKTSVKRVTKVLQQTNQRLVLMDDVIFVNNGAPTGNGIQAGSLTGTGTAELPVNTIQAGANIAGTNSNSSGRVWNVYTQGGAAYAENVTANLGSVNFVGSGSLIQGQGGKSFGTGPAPSLAGGLSASNINTLGIKAYNISGGFAGAEGILANNITNLRIDQVVIQNAGTHGISLSNLNGTAALVDVSVNGSAGNGVQVTGGNVIATLLAQNLDISGSGDAGLNFINATGTYQFDATSSIDNASGAAFRMEGGSADVTYEGGINQANNNPLVAIVAGHTGDVTFQTGTLSATAGGGLLFDNADGVYNFLGTTTLTNGAKIAVLNGSAGDFAFATGTSVTNGSGQGLLVDNSTADVTYAGTISQNSGSLFQAINHSTGTVAFTAASNLSATGGDGLLFNNADGTYQFLGTTTLNGGDAGIDLVNGSDGTFAFGAGTSITNPSGHAFFADGGNSNVTYAGSITDNSGFAVQILNHGTGTVTFAGTVASTAGGNGIQLLNNAGTFQFANVTTANTSGTGVEIVNSATATHTFANISITSPTARGVSLINAGTVSLLDGSINGTGAEGIFSQNTALTVTSLTIGDNTSLATPTFGIVVQNNDGTARVVNLSNNSIRAQIHGISTVDSGVAGELTLILDGNTYESTLAAGKALNIVGSGLDSTTIRSMAGGTVIGNGTGGGINFERVTFDSDGTTAGIQQVAAGNWNIGQGTGARVFGDGARFVNPTGDLAFGALNIFNNNGTGLYVDTKGLGTTFTLGNTGGAVDTINGTGLNLDPLTVNLTFSSVSSTNSATGGIILDEVAGTLNLGNVTITNTNGAAYLQNNSTAAVTAGTVNITNAGGRGMVFSSAGGSFTAGATTINGFNGTGIDFTGSGVNATFGVTAISNALHGGTGTGIDLSDTTGNAISFAGGSSISNVAVGVELSAGGTTATSANALFVFGDGEGVIDKESSINATTTVNAIGLAATGTYNFQDVNFTGIAGFPAAAGSAMFVSATAVNGVGDGSLLNPYSVQDANAIATAGTFAFLDGSYDFATLNGGAAFTLSNGQSVVGLDNSFGVVYGTSQPINVLGDFGTLGGTATRANTGNGTLTIVNSAAANVFELGGSNTISNITVNGSGSTSALFSGNGSSGVIINGVAVSGLAAGNTALSFNNMTGNVTVQGNNINTTAGTLLNITGGSATYIIGKGTLPDPGSTTGTLAGAAVNISNITGGAVTLDGASITSLNVTGILAGSIVNVNNTTITGGAALAVNIGNSAGNVNFNAATSIVGGTSAAFTVNGGTGDIIHNGTITQNNAASAVFIINRTGGATTFNGNITANTSTAIGIDLQNNTGSTTNFNGGFSIGTTTATGFNATNGGTLNVAAGPSANINTTEGGRGLNLNFGVTLGSVNIDSITVTDGLSSGTAGAVLIGATSGGSLSIGNISVERAIVDAISISNVASGTYAFTGLTSVNSAFLGANAIDISNTAAGASVSFANINLTTVNGAPAVLLSNNAGTVSFTGGQINRVTGGDGINSTDTNLTVDNVQIGNNTTFAVAGRGINIANTGANVRTVTLTNNNIRSGAEAIRTTDSATGTLFLSLNGNSLQTTTGVKSLSVTGAALNSTIVTSLNGGTVIGNNVGGGVLFDRVTFDSDIATGGNQQVNAGGWIIGQGTGARVVGDGLNFLNPTGDLNYGLLNIFNSGGTGLLVDAKLTTFTLGGAGSGTVNTSGGTALNLDPLTANLSFGNVVSNNSGAGNPGVILDGVAGSVTIGSLTVDSSGADGLVVQNSSANVTLGNVFISNTGDDGIHLAGNTGSFQTSVGGSVIVAGAAGDGIDLTGLTANPTVNMLSTVLIAGFGGIGVNFTGANVTAAFGVTTIANGGVGTAIDLSSTTGTRNITFAAGSEISNVSIGVQIGATSGTAANANFIFGDGMSANGLQSSISAGTTVAALGLDPAPNTPGVYNFNDVVLTGAALFPAAPGGAVFVSATALNGVGDGSLANPYSVADANALTGTLTFGFLDGTYNFASLGVTGFTLEANQSATGLDNGNGISYGLLQPNRVLGNFGALGGTATRANTGNGTLSITNGTAAGAVFSLLGGNSVSHLTLTGEAGATDPSSLFSINGSAPGFNNAGGISIQGVTMANVQSSGSAISATNSAGTVLIQNNNINIGARLLDINSGTSAFSILKGTGTLTAASLRFRNTTGGSFAISGASLNTPGGTSVTLDNNDAAVTLTNLAITRTTGATAFSIDTLTGGSTGAITIDGASTLDSTAGAAFSIGLGARNINASALNFSNIGTASGTVINSVGQSGGTISFGNINITGFNSAGGIAVNLQAASGGTVLFGDLDITTTAGRGLNAGGINFNAAGTPTISATGATALTFNGTTINGGAMNFSSVASTGGVNGISMTNVTGTTGFNLITISGSTGDGVLLSNAGTVHLRDGSINNVGGHGVNMLNTGGSIGRTNNVDIGTTGTVAGNGINVLMNDAVARTLDIFTVNVGSGSNVAGKGIFYTHAGSAAQQLFIESSTTNSTGNGVEVVKSSTGNLEFRLLTSSIKTVNGAALTVNGATGSGALFVTQQSGNDFTIGAGGGVLYNEVTFDANLGTAGFQEVDDGYFETVGSATSAGTALSFISVSGALGFDLAHISNPNGNGLFSSSSFALRISGGSANVTNGAALNITNTALNLTFAGAGTDVGAANPVSNGIFIGQNTTGTVNLGDVNVTNAVAAGIRIESSMANFSASSIQVNGAQYGISLFQNLGAFSVSGSTTIQNATLYGIHVEQSAATFTGTTNVTGGVVGIALYGAHAKSFGTTNVSGVSGTGIQLGAANVFNSGSASFGTTSVNVLAGAANGISVTGFNGTGTFGATTIGTAATVGSGGTVGLGLVTGIASDGTNGSLTFASLGITQTVTGISSAGHLTDLTVTGATNITNTSSTGISITGGANGDHIFDSITITGPTATGFRFGVNTGTFLANGTTTLTGITGTGINANAATGDYVFGDLNITYSGAGRGIDLRDSNVRFGTNNFTLTGNGTAGSIGIDLSGSLNPNGANSPLVNIGLATDAGQTAAISGVATGVKLGDAVDGSAGAYLTYGNQTLVNSGSSIAVIAGGTTIDTSNLTSTDPFTQGRYEFRGVFFTGQATFEGANPNFLFVGTNAAGAANGANPNNRISTATFLASYNTAVALAGKTVVFVNDDVAGINLGANTLNLGANTVLAGFGNGATIVVTGGVQPVNVIGDTFIPGGGNFTDAAGAATVLTNAATSTLTLNTGNTLSNFILGNGATSIAGTNFGTLTINGMVINNPVGGAMTLNTGALAGTGFTSVTSGGGVNAISLTNVTGSISFGTGSLAGASGATFLVSGGTVSTTYNGTITQNNAANAVSFNGKTGGTSTFGGLITASTSTANAINLTTNTGATINFNGGLNLTTTTGTGFNATGGGTVTVAATAGAETITSTGGTAVNIDDTIVGAAGITFDSITANGTSANMGINLSDTGSAGIFTVSGTTAVSGRSANGISINGNSRANFGVVNVTGRTGTALGIDMFATTGTLVFGNTTVTNAAGIATLGHGIRYFQSTGGSVTFAQTNVDQNGAIGNAVDISGSGSFTSNGGLLQGSTDEEVLVGIGTGVVNIASAITNTSGGSIFVTLRSAGSVTLSGNINDTGTGMVVSGLTGSTVTLSGASKIFNTGANNAVVLNSNTGGIINFTNGGLDIDTTSGTGFTATAGGTVTVQGTGNTITTTGGVAANLSGITIGGAGINWDSITASGATANSGILLANTGNTGAFTVTGTTAISGRSADAIDITGTGNATFGVVNVTGRTGSAIGIDIDTSSGTLVFGNTTLTNAGNSSGVGIRYLNSTGSATFAQTNIDQNGAAGNALLVSGSSGTFTSNGGTIQGSTSDEVNVTGGTGTVSIASAISNSSGGVVSVQTRTTGNVTFSGNINSTAGGGITVSNVTGGTVTFSGTSKAFTGTTATPVLLSSNTGGTIDFTNGGLVINTTTLAGFSATGGGTVTVQGTGNTITTTTGQAFNMVNTTIGANDITFASINTGTTTAGIVLDAVGANDFTVGSGAITATSRGVDINGGSGNVTIGASITTSGAAARSVEVTGHTAGTVAFSAAINDTSLGLRLDGNTGGSYNFSSTLKTFNTTTNDAVTLTNNTGATINFSSGLDIDTTTGTGFTATGGGTVNVTATGGDESIASVGGRAMLLNGVTAGITFDSVSSSTSTTTGVDLQTVAGTVTINGGALTGAAGTEFNVTGGGASITYSGTMNGTAGRLIAVANTTGGSVTFNTATVNGLVDGGTGILIDGAAGNVTVNNGDLNGARGIEILGDAANNATGTFTFNNVTIDTTAGATNHAFIVDGDQGTATNNDVSATINLNNVDITNPGGLVARIVGMGGGAVTFSSTSAINRNNGGLGILVDSNAGGAITFNSTTKTLTTSVNNAVTLTDNGGTTIDFMGGNLAITTTTGAGFTATGGGTVTVQGTVNTINSGSGTALNVANTTIGGAGLTFRSISANGGTRGIVLNNTGAGGLTVTGTGGDGTGGTIQNITERGIELLNASNISLSNMALTNASTTDGASGDDINTTGFNAAIYLSSVSTIALDNVDISGTNQQGINGNTVSGFSLNNSTIFNVGNEVEEGAIKMRGLTGTASITNSTLAFSAAETVEIVNASGTLTLNVNNSTFRDTQASGVGGTGIQLRNTGTSTGIVNITNSTFLRIRTVGLNVQSLNTATSDVDVSSSTFNPDTGTMIGIDLAADNASTLNFNIQNNTAIYSKNGPAVNIFGDNTATIHGRINNNNDIRVITNAGSNVGSGVRVNLNKNSVGRIEIKDNTINVGSDDSGIDVSSIGKNNTNPGGTLDVTITGNNVTIGNTSAYGIVLISASNAGDNNIMRANVANNVVTRGATSIASFRARAVSASGSLLLQGFVTNPEATWNANSNTPMSISGSEVSFGGSGTFGAGTALLPTNPALDADPLLFAPGGATAGLGSILTESSLSLLSSAAVDRWIASGVTSDQLALLQSVTFVLSDSLPAGYLGAADGTQVYLSVDAAGNNWFVDGTPWDDSEYVGTGLSLTASSTSEAAGLVDALTVVMHELGHVIGFDDAYGSGVGGPLMDGYLGTGQRLLPSPGGALTIPTGNNISEPQPLLYQAPAPKTLPLLNQAPASEGGWPSVFNVPAQRSFKNSNVVPLLQNDGGLKRGSVLPFGVTPTSATPNLIPSLIQPIPLFSAPLIQEKAPAKKVRTAKRGPVSASR